MPLRFKYNVLTSRFDLVQVADDTAYGASWDNDTVEAPSKNAVYDKIESIDPSQMKKYIWIMAG